MRLRQGLGPRFQALASATGWMRAMTPSPMRTMAAKCFARVGLVRNIVGRRAFGGVVLSADGRWSLRQQLQKQIPEGMTERKAGANTRAPAGLSASHHKNKGVMLRSR
jgi:hypothetical protein